ncbi:MAG: FtsX-like permease family protein, partial [Phycisphaerales bacterium]
EQLLEQARHLPDVQSAALASCGFYVVSGRGYLHFSIEGQPPDGNGELPMACIQMVTPDFIRTMGIPIVKGRDFSERDVQDGARCVLINECLARRHFAGIDPIGRRINGMRIDGMPIVGVVRDVRDYGQSETDLNVIYTLISNDCFRRSDLYVRTSGRCEPLIEGLRARIAALDPDLETPVRPLEENLSHISSTDRFIGVLLGSFSQVALLLAAVGLYGSVQYAVTQHTHEIGVRMAIGAAQSSVAGIFLRRGVRLVLCGTGLGLLGGYIASRIMASLFYEAKATDCATLIGATATLFAVALVACYIPARRAAKVDPMVALRCE